MERIRLTKRINANDPNDMDGSRQKVQPKIDKYTNFDPAKDDVGDRKVKTWKEDPKLRDEMNVTKIKQARMWQASKLATKLAMYLLGEKAPSAMIKAQAAEFLPLGNTRLARAVSRFAKTEYLYADEETEEVKEPVEEVKEEACVAEETEEVKEPVEEVKEEACVAEETEEVKEQAVCEECGKEPCECTTEDETIDTEEVVEETVEDDSDEISDAELA